jgi:hypothetical protein
MQVKMWQTITQADIEEARARLSRKREEALSRHAAEIRSLDAQLDDIESFERVVACVLRGVHGRSSAAPARGFRSGGGDGIVTRHEHGNSKR